MKADLQKMQSMLNFLCKIDLKREPKEQSQEVKTQETNPQKRKKKRGGCVIGNHRRRYKDGDSCLHNLHDFNMCRNMCFYMLPVLPVIVFWVGV